MYIWGTGRITGKVIGRWIELDKIEGFIDNNAEVSEYMGKPVYRPAEMKNRPYDAIVVANLFSSEVKKQCEELSLDKIIYLYANGVLNDINDDYEFVAKILGEEYANVIRTRYHSIRGPEASGDLCLSNTKYEGQTYLDTDYVRIKCFELAVKEIRKRNLTGSVAEAGVFKGEFAQYINHAFPESTLHLFDTFDGFDANEALQEVKRGNCTETFIQAYKKTNVKYVIERMENLEKIEIHQGFFPGTAQGIEDEFKFVSLDMDFEESIYEGLVFFYPKLVQGGYIFVHDYNSSLLGVEHAVDRYEQDYHVILSKFPICDANGTLIITK